MKTNIGRTRGRQRGAILLAIIAIIAIIAIVWAGYKLIQKLNKWKPDPHHGQGTNAEPDSLVAYRAAHPELVSNLTVTVTLPGQFQLTLPVEALTADWYYWVQTSSNLNDWTDTDLDWAEALELQRTNHAEPARFYRRVLWW